MKKTYSKPEIVFEGFAMNTNLAAGCEKIVRTFEQFACPISSTGGIAFFSMGGGSCNAPGPGDLTDNDGFCYHNPSDANNIFNS